MGRAIDMEKDIDFLKKEVAQLKTAFSGLSATVETLQNTAPTRKGVDLHKTTKPVASKKKAKVKETYLDKVIEETEA